LKRASAAPAATTRRAAASTCGWCGGAIEIRARGRIPKWCSAACRQRAWEQSRAAASGRCAVEVVERVVRVPGRARAGATARRVAGAPARAHGTAGHRQYLRPRPARPRRRPERSHRRVRPPSEHSTTSPLTPPLGSPEISIGMRATRLASLGARFVVTLGTTAVPTNERGAARTSGDRTYVGGVCVRLQRLPKWGVYRFNGAGLVRGLRGRTRRGWRGRALLLGR
jgi:hypothetical protein